jgi:hypothetical protein
MWGNWQKSAFNYLRYSVSKAGGTSQLPEERKETILSKDKIVTSSWVDTPVPESSMKRAHFCLCWQGPQKTMLSYLSVFHFSSFVKIHIGALKGSSHSYTLRHLWQRKQYCSPYKGHFPVYFVHWPELVSISSPWVGLTDQVPCYLHA